MAKRDFKDKVAVITGAAGGIGKALCKRFAAGGAKVVALDIDEHALHELKKELEEAGVELAAYPCDVTSEKNCQDVINYALSNLPIDLLATMQAFLSKCFNYQYRSNKSYEVNFYGALYCTKAALKPHRK